MRYLVADMETFVPEGRFNAIVFAESVYYSPNCAQLLRRYSPLLTTNGCFIVSIFRTKRSNRIQQLVHSVTTVVDAITTVNEIGTWDCEVLRPLPQPPPVTAG